jgi:alkylation response protein AidB-like acyl-CoA dehydrogenase
LRIDPGEDAAAFRAEVREWLAGHVAARGRCRRCTPPMGFARHRERERELAAARLAVVSWPPEYGGRNAPLLE